MSPMSETFLGHDPPSPQSAKVLFGDHHENSKNDGDPNTLPVKVSQEEELPGGFALHPGKENNPVNSSLQSPTELSGDKAANKSLFSSPTETLISAVRSTTTTPRSILKKPRYTSYASLESSQDSIEEEVNDNVSSLKRGLEDESSTTTTATKFVSVRTPSRKRAKSSRQDHASLQAKDILSRAASLFPDSADRIRHMPVISARIFACFTLHQDEQLAAPTPRKTKHLQSLTPMTRRRRQSQLLSRTGSEEIAPLMDLCNALVELELESYDQPTPKKLVHFNAHDGSAIKPAVDVILGSSTHQEKCIRLIHKALIEAKQVDSIRQLKMLCKFLENLKEDSYQQLSIANSIEGYEYYDSSRVQTAVESYLEDFQTILERLVQPSGEDATTTKPLSLETMLSDKCGKSIRFILRSILNPVPFRACFGDQKRIAEVIELHSESQSETGGVDENNLSSIVSNALRNIYDMFGKDVLDDMEIILKDVKKLTFCDTSVCRRGVGNKADPEVFSEQDWEDVHHEVWRASRFLAAYEGARFLQELFSVYDVMRELQNRDEEWKDLQKYAAMLEEVGLDDEMHLAFLSAPFGQVSDNLLCLLQRLDDPAEQCYENLAWLSRRFKLGKKDAKHVKHHPQRKQIRHLSEVLEEAREIYLYFPSVKAARR